MVLPAGVDWLRDSGIGDTSCFGSDGDGGLGDRLLEAVLRSEKTATSWCAVKYLLGERLRPVDQGGREDQP